MQATLEMKPVLEYHGSAPHNEDDQEEDCIK